MRKTIVVLLVLCAKIAQAQIYIDSYRFAAGAVPGIVTDNLIAWYDASNAASYPGSGSTWFDLTTNNRDLSISGATYSATNGGIFDFDGSDDFMSYNADINQSLKCLSIWFNSDLPFNDQNLKALIDFDVNSNNGSFFLGTFTSGINGEDYTLVTSGGLRISSVTTTPSLANEWYNITINYNGSDYDFYINNTLYAKVTTTGHAQLFNAIKIFIGKKAFDNSYFFDGQIGEVYMYNEALTIQQLTDNYNATKTRYGY